MCAIAGILGLAVEEATIKKMQATMERRGPDGKGSYMDEYCVLLHSRLAIIDPERGQQPMQLFWGGEEYIITYNGELYNTQEIRKELERLGHAFETFCDTEVVLHAYAQWGKESLARLNGIFAFGIWKKYAKSLFLARDRMGVKPLFYTRKNGGLIFASEIKTILAHPQIPAKLDEDGIAQILLLGPSKRPGSGVLQNIFELMPGQCAEYCRGTWSVEQYWQLKDEEHLDSFEQTVETVRFLVLDAIGRQMVSSVPIGTFLSGGLDSSIISAVCANQMRQTGECLSTFSVDYENNDKYFVPGKFQPTADAMYILQMQEYIRSNHKNTVLTSYDLADALSESVAARDLPGMADVDSSLLVFCKAIRRDVKVALSGECADEIFGGYPWYRDPEIRAAEGFPWAQNTKLRASLMHPDRKKLDALAFVNEHYRACIDSADILPGTDPLERRMKEMVVLNQKWFMQTLLDRKDRMSMYCSLEVRVPFCDHRIAQYLYHVPWKFKDWQGREKGLLRKAMDGLLPESVLWRKKSPYPKTHDPLYLTLVRDRYNSMLRDPNEPIFHIADKTVLQKLVNEELDTPWYGQLMRLPQTLAYVLQINDWMKRYQVQVV